LCFNVAFGRQRVMTTLGLAALELARRGHREKSD
jgi:hypothetical protein